MESMTLTPAYGRDYKSKKEILADFDAEKDFILNSFNQSGLINKQQIPKGTSITFRYKKKMNICIHVVK